MKKEFGLIPWACHANVYEVNTRQYTPEGTFDAFSAHLSRLSDMGVEVLWFMPITPISVLNRKGSLGATMHVQVIPKSIQNLAPLLILNQS